jgi:hypothetical protein
MAHDDLPPPAQRSPSVPAPKSGLTPSQAIRVFVVHAPDGVRVVPAGTPLQSPAVEAILVAVDPAADLATWLTRR